MFRLLFGLIACAALTAGTASRADTSAERRIYDALTILSHVPSGQALINQGLHFWGFATTAELTQAFKMGQASRTDAVLTRHFNPETGEETRERQVTIYLRAEQALGNLVLDIAHEMVHATARPAWDPYDPELTGAKYIQASIDGVGGEVAAVISECKVALELSSRFGVPAPRCRGYLTAGKLDDAKIRQDFYRVGKWQKDLVKRLGEEIALLPLLSADAPKLFSSTGNAPYPVALLREFDEITQIACENSRKRELASLNPAGASGSRFLVQRCRRSQAQASASR
jgi:hypothetical protein